MTDINFNFRKGGGAEPEILYGTVEIKPTLAHARGTALVLPAPTKIDLVDGKATAVNVSPTPAPVDGEIAWAQRVKVTDRHGHTWEWMVGVPDSTTAVEFTSLPRYFETKPPAFGEGPQGIPGEAATVAVGTVVEGSAPQVTNSGTNTDAVLDFVLQRGSQGPKGDNSTYLALNTKNMSDAPNTYPNGLSSVRSSSTANGWPYVVTSITTSYTGYEGTAIQVIKDAWGDSSRPPLIRWANVQTANTWTEFVPLVPGVATTTANGLMSSADKSKLEGITPLANTKTFSALASTYSTGVSIVQVRVSDGWPLTTTGTVVTHKTSTDSTAVGQWLYPAEGGEPLYRSSNASGLWSDFSTMATQSWVSAGRGYVTPEQFGAVGNGTTDDSSAMQTALDYSVDNGVGLRLRGGVVYRVNTGLTAPTPSASKNVVVDIDTIGSGKATLLMNSTSTSDILRLTGTVMATTKLTNYVKVLDKAWGATSVAGFSAGNLLAVRSSASWYYDPRPEGSDARKSELHRIYKLDGNTVLSEGPAEDGYNVGIESVDLISIKPIKVSIKNIHFERPLPAEGTSADGLRRVGLRVYMADEPLIENVSTSGLTASGIRVLDSYNGTIRDCSIKLSNNYFEGYGVAVGGTAHMLIDNCHIATSRRGVDVSQGTYTVARHTTIQNCVVTGGGRSSRGDWFGWDPLTNGLGSRQSGLGSHGAAEYTNYLNNTIYTMTEMLSCNGGHETIRGNTFIGKTNLSCVGLALGGGNAIIEDNQCISGWQGTAKTAVLVSDRRPRDFIQVYPSWNSNNNNNSRLVVRNNYVEVQRSFILFGTSSPANTSLPQYVNVTGNRAGFADGSTTPGYLLYNPTSTLEASGSRWTVGINEIRHDTNSAEVFITRNINLNGAKVLDFTTSGPTT